FISFWQTAYKAFARRNAMAGRRTDLMDLRELLRYLQTTSNVSAIQRATGLHRRTIRRYRQWAVTQGLLEQLLPPVEALHELMATTLERAPPPQTVSSVAPYREVVTQLHAGGGPGPAIGQRLRARLSRNSVLPLPLSPPARAVSPSGDGARGTRAWQRSPGGFWLCGPHA